jgi:nucleoside 2-deoxyribosyltransferase
MKIYFAGSIRGGREDKELYFQLIQRLSKYGQVLTGHVGDKEITEFGESDQSDEYIYNRDMSWLQEAEVVIAEVSTPSLGVGYEIGKAEEMGKKILCLYRNQNGKRLSAIISGNKNVRVVEYESLEQAFGYIEDFLKNN